SKRPAPEFPIEIDTSGPAIEIRRAETAKAFMAERKSKSTSRTAVLLFVCWSIVGLIFTAVSCIAALIENRPYALGNALRLNLIQFYLWGAFSPLLFWLSRRFTIEFR